MLILLLIMSQDYQQTPSSTSNDVSPPISSIEIAQSMPQPYEDFMPADIDIFDTNYLVEDAEIQAVISGATQDFWVNFPGEVGMY
jgi:hypothetical protein